jgi:hypothetical protein
MGPAALIENLISHVYRRTIKKCTERINKDPRPSQPLCDGPKKIK